MKQFLETIENNLYAAFLLIIIFFIILSSISETMRKVNSNYTTIELKKIELEKTPCKK